MNFVFPAHFEARRGTGAKPSAMEIVKGGYFRLRRWKFKPFKILFILEDLFFRPLQICFWNLCPPALIKVEGGEAKQWGKKKKLKLQAMFSIFEW